MELPTAREGSAQPFSLLGEAAVLGQPLVLSGRMFGTAHLQHSMQLGQDVVVTLTLSRSRHCWGRQQAPLEMGWAFQEFCVPLLQST